MATASNGGKLRGSAAARVAAASFKIIALGHGGVGKTSLIIRYTNGVYDGTYQATIGVDFFVKHVTVQGQDVDVQIWDTAGQERFRAISPSLYRKVQGVLLVFDVCDLSSFRSVEQWMRDIIAMEGDDIPMILVGNKCDRKLERLISTAQGREKADALRIPYFETSAREDVGVSDAFEALISSVVLRAHPTGLPGAAKAAASKRAVAAPISKVEGIAGKRPAAAARPGRLHVTPAASEDDSDEDKPAGAGACGC